ncbi:monooxygenase [Nocardioides szechwanensis]|uniref:L-lysine N6-monooxygenase MbtG n=1 Tax=Nocardioides szechwanensis TaxID=1005944 RepID=A0A1G9UNC1_9ACTN|nr:SidA/IucD/PvdA family monooxygenase [Nocardioides szechwanensis]GEP33200.1 monooxygenase [Nocardioides szechwanensis]SDM61418.1 lysine N6-hydroxylase [Nocardioides szechwanensis]
MTTYDVIGIGVGPFNLGLASLTDPLDLDAVFLEARDELAWHPGMMLDDATLQVPFLADLVTMADPTSRWSFLSYLKETGNLYPFYIRESFYPLRREYDDYCRWAAERLSSVRFGQAVVSVEHVDDCRAAAYVVTTGTGEEYVGRRLVLGTGTQPRVLECVHDAGGPATHSADYLSHKAALQHLDSIAIVGSGQSAAEIYLDLLAEAPDHGYALTWLTRSPRFFPMEYTKLTLEMTSPEYTAYFQGLPELTRARLLREQRALYKGISGDLVDAIFDLHYQQRVTGDGPRTTLVTNTAVTGAAWDGTAYDLELHHTETDESFGLRTQGLVLATGYEARVPAFLDGVRDRIAWDAEGRYVASSSYAVDHWGQEIFVQNAEEHTHGFVAPDLGMGAYRNSVIVAALTGREVYPVEKRIAVQSFGVPDHLRRAR